MSSSARVCVASTSTPLPPKPERDAALARLASGEIEALANTAPGSRNHALNRASFALYQLVAGGVLDGAEVQQRLLGAAHANGLMAEGPRAVMVTIASGARAGMQHPRSRPIGGRP